MSSPTRVLILGGGFGGLYTALELERLQGRAGPFAPGPLEVTLVGRENFFLFTPMLHEVASGDLDLTHIVNPVRRLLRGTRFFCGEVDAIDLERRRVHVSHGDEHHAHELEYDHLVLGLGSITTFHGTPGAAEHAITIKTLGDAIHLRNRLIGFLEEADFECCASLRRAMLTVVVAGGGFAGVETAAALHDLMVQGLRFYPNLSPEQVRVVIVHSGSAVLPELGEKLGRYAAQTLRRRGIEIVTGARVARCGPGEVTLSDGTTIESRTLVWAAGTAPSPLLEALPCARTRGRVAVDETLAVPEYPGVWALGDCACVPDPRTGGTHPPTAQHAIRQARCLAENIAASAAGRTPRPFRFRTLGQLASIGHHAGVARVMGVNFSGFIAWWLWRTIYLAKLPRTEKKLRVAIDWTLDLIFGRDLVQYQTRRASVRQDRTTAVEAPHQDAPHSRIEAMVVPAGAVANGFGAAPSYSRGA